MVINTVDKESIRKDFERKSGMKHTVYSSSEYDKKFISYLLRRLVEIENAYMEACEY